MKHLPVSGMLTTGRFYIKVARMSEYVHWQLQPNPLKWIAMGPDYEYPCFILYIVSKQNQTNDIHLSRLST